MRSIRLAGITLLVSALLSACGGGGGGGSVPANPTNVTATPVSSTSIRVSWDAVPGATGYLVERRTDAADYGQIATKSANETEHLDTTVAAGTTYSYRVKARNAAGSSPGAESQAATTPPDDGSDGDHGVATIQVTSDRSTLAVGETATITASARDAGGNLVPGQTFSFSVTGGIGSVSPDSAAGETTFTASAVGSGQVCAASGGKEGCVNLMVTEVAVETFSRYGFVTMQQMDSQGAFPSFVSGSGVFIGLDEPLSLPENGGNPYESVLDTCFLPDETEPDPEPMPTPEPEGTPLDAGEPLTVRAGADVYTTLTKQAQLTHIYSTDFTNLPAPPLPEALTITIPGAAGGFPAMADKAFPALPSFTLTGPADPRAITQATVFTWTGGSSTSVVILTGAFEVAGDDVPFSCVARDDGEFSFPAATKAELDARGLSAGALMMAMRSSFAPHREGDALLYLAVTRSIIFGSFDDFE